MVLAGYDNRLRAFTITIYEEESGANLGNMGYRCRYGIKNVAVILTKPRTIVRKAVFLDSSMNKPIDFPLSEVEMERLMREYAKLDVI